MTGLEVSLCRICHWCGFPLRLWCPVCLDETLETQKVVNGTVEEATLMHRVPGRILDKPVELGTVRLDCGGQLIARLEGARPRQRVVLSCDAGAPVARPQDS